MKTNVEVMDHCQRQLKLEVPVKEISAKYDQVYAGLQKTAQVPGFRVGKVPREILEGNFAAKVKEEVLSQLISAYYQKAIEENSLEPISYPEISDIKFEENKPLFFTAKVDVKPEVKLKNYKGIKVKKKKAEVIQEEIDKTLKLLQENFAVVEPVLEDRALKEGDFVLSDIECFVDGTCIDKRENMLLFLGKENAETSKDNFTQQLFGAKPGQMRKVNMALPKDYPQAKYASKEAEFNVSLKQIKQKKIPELNDDLAKQIGNYQGLEQLKEAVKRDLIKKKEIQINLETQQQIFGYLLGQNSFAVPPALVKKRLDYLIEEAGHKLEDQGFKKEEVEKQKKTMEEKLKPEAEKQVRLYFILNEIAKTEDLKVAPEELESRYLYLSHLYDKTVEEIKEEATEHNLIEDLKEELLREKTVDLLVKDAQIEEESK